MKIKLAVGVAFMHHVHMQDKERFIVEGLMMASGITRSELANKTGLNVRTIDNFFSGQFRRRTLAKIEFALQLELISTRQQLQDRIAIAREVGADPGSIPLRDLRRLAKPLGVLITKRTREQIINDLITKLSERNSDNERKQASG